MRRRPPVTLPLDGRPAAPPVAPALAGRVKRWFDVVCASAGLMITAPVLAAAALAIRCVSPGPVLYRARRVGVWGRVFTMYKLRTMRHAPQESARPLTAADDPRVFPLGRLLRRTKIDELPQLINVIRGEMSIVGPRPEAPAYVCEHYGTVHLDTLRVRPGLVSPGTLYYYTHGERTLIGDDAHRAYVEHLLPVKLALDLAYLRRASFWYDLRLVGRAVVVIAATLAGRRRFAEPPELAEQTP